MQQLVLVQGNSQLVRSLEPYSSDLLFNYAQIHEYCACDCALVADIEHSLSRNSLFGAEKRVSLLSPPNRYFLSAYRVVAVLQIEHFPFSCAQNGTASGDCLALIEPSRRLHPEYFSRHRLHAGNARGTAHQLDRMERNGAISGLKRGHRCSNICQDRHNNHLHFFASHVVGEVFLIENVLQVEVVIVIGRQNSALSLHGVHQLHHRLRVLQEWLLVISLELCAVELAHETVHVPAAGKRQMLPVEQSSLEARELHQVYGHLRVPDVQEDHVPHLVQISQLFQPVIGVLRCQSTPVVHQTHRLLERQLSATQQGRSFLIGEVCGNCDISDSQGQIVAFDDAFGLSQQTQQHFLDGHCGTALPALHKKQQIFAALICHFFVFHLFGEEVGIVPDPQKALWCANGIVKVSFEFDDCRFSYESFGGGVSHERGRLSEVGLVGEHFQFFAVEGAQFETPGADVNAHYHRACLHHYYYTTTNKKRHYSHTKYSKQTQKQRLFLFMLGMMGQSQQYRMRRQNSNLNEDVILFIGECEVLTLNSTHQIALVTRTLLLKEDVLLTYHNPIASVKESRLSRNKAPIPLDKLTNHQHEYKISAAMRARLLLGRRDEGVDAYLKELRIDKPQQGSNIVAVIHTDQNFMHGFVFREEQCALDFYQSLNAAIATQIYIQKLPESIPFNPKIVNMLGETLNGRCCIDPDDFGEGRQEEDEVRFVLDFLKGMQGENAVNFKGQLAELQLRFRVIDETSRDYAVRFLEVSPQRVERLVISACEITSNMLAQLLSAPSLTDKFARMQELNLSKNSLNDDVFATLTKLLKSCRKLQTLNLNKNSISFQKEAIIVGFLQAIAYFQLNMQLASNCIRSAKHITKYLINAEGTLPLSELDISFNPIAPEELSALTKAYLAKTKHQGYSFHLHLNQLEFQEAHSFQFLQEQYRARKPNSMAIPMTITKHVIRRKGKDIGSTEEELNTAAKIEDLYRSYAIEVFKGNFFRLKQIRAELRSLGVKEEAIQAETQKYSQQKQVQEQMMVKKMERCYNFELQSKDIIAELNQTIRFCRRKALSGTAFNILACIKRRVEEKVAKEAEEGNLGRAYRQSLYSQRGRYKSFYEQFFREDYVFHVNLVSLLQMSEQQLLKEQMGNARSDNLTVFLVLQYLLTERPQRHHLFVLQTCLADPRLSSLKIARFQAHNIIKIYHKNRVGKNFLPLPSIPEQRNSFLSVYGIETYQFSDSFIESGVSSSSYVGMLSRGRVQGQQEKQVLAFIEISKNFLKYLYYTPQQLSEQTLIYLNSITTHLSNLQNPQENSLKLVLAQELLLHMMTFFDSTRYQPLKNGLLTSIAEFIARRVALPQEILKRLAAHVLKTEGFDLGLQLHNSIENEPWQGKVDWRVADLPILGALLMGRGKFQVRVADAAHPQLLLNVEVDQLDTVLDLWGKVKANVEQLNEITNISAANIDYYWLCGGKGDGPPGAICYLASYQHIGNLIFDHGFDRFYLRRVLYRPQEHSIDFLSRMKYEQLLAIYQQAKESIRITASLFLSPQTTLTAISLTIWTDILLTDQLMLGDLRRREDEESQGRYALEREKVVGECMAKLYNRYVPVGFALDQANRNKVIFETKSKQMAAVPKNLNEAIKTAILDLLKIVGITAFTTVLPSTVYSYTLYINNHHILFEDRSKGEPKFLRTNFRDIVEFDLTADGDAPILRFQVMQASQQEGLGLHSFSIQGDSFWIGQCFSLITQLARNRLSYPPQLLFANEDELACLSDCPVKAQIAPLLQFPLMDIDRYFSFSLPRREEPTTIALVPPSEPPKPQETTTNDRILPQNAPAHTQKVDTKVEAVQSLGVIGQRDPQLQAIVKSVEEVEEVVTSRRSSTKGKEVTHKRRSKNR